MSVTASEKPQGPDVIYVYKDERDTPLFEVVRTSDKRFFQRKPDGTLGLDCVRRVPYRLSEVVLAEQVFLCEGEKDVETLRSVGIIASTNPGGARGWRQEFAVHFCRKDIVVLPDQDTPGYEWAQRVLHDLMPLVNTLKRIDLPGLEFGSHGDVTDWLAAGHTRAELLALVETTSPESKPVKEITQVKRGGLELTRLGDLLNEPEEQISWLLKGKLPAGGISTVAAKPKVGKSTLARCLALAVATGTPFLGCETAQGPVIYLALEEKRSEVRRHFSDLGAAGEEPIHIHCAAAPQDAMADLCRLTREIRPALVIVDPLFKFVRVADEKAYAEVCRAIEPLLTLARETGAHVMLVHHCGKADRADATDAILGSTAIFGGVDSALILKRSDRYRTLQSGQRYGVDWPETVLEFDPDTRALTLGAEKSEADVQSVAAGILGYLKTAEGPKTEPEIDEAVEGKTVIKRKSLRELVGQGKICRDGGGKRGDPFKYSFLFPCSTHIVGTREQEPQNGVEPPANAGDILVPACSPDSEPVPQQREQPSFDEGEL